MDKEFQAAIDRIKTAEALAPPGSYEHELYVKAALFHEWSAIRTFADLRNRFPAAT